MIAIPFKVNSYTEFIGTINRGRHIIIGNKDENSSVPHIVGTVIPLTDGKVALIMRDHNSNYDYKAFEYLCLMAKPTNDTQVMLYDSKKDAEMRIIYTALDSYSLHGMLLNDFIPE